MADDNNIPVNPMSVGAGPTPDLSAGVGSTPVLAGSPGSSAASRPPSPSAPILYSLIRNMISPPMRADAPGQPARPMKRLDAFEGFLGDFIGALGQGFAVAGRGPGSFGRGFGGAVTAPYERSVQQFQLGQQAQANQAEIGQRQAQTQLEQEQAQYYPQEQQARIAALTQQPRFDPQTRQYLGVMNDAQYQQYIRGQGAANLRSQNQTPDTLKVLMARADKALQSGDSEGYNSVLKELAQLQGTKTAEARQSSLDRLKQTQQFQTWKTKFDGDIRMRIAQMSQNKAPAAMMQTAEFSKSGLNLLDDAQTAFNDLKNRGVLGSVSSDKLEDWLFGKGLIDPSLPPKDRQEISQMRAALGYTSTAAMRAHTGRTSQEIYNDFKNTLRLGQGSDALEGAFAETRNMLTEYANSASDANIQAIRGGAGAPVRVNTGAAPSGFPRKNPGATGSSRVDSLVSRYAR